MSKRAIFRVAVIGVLVLETSILIAYAIFDDGSLDPAWDMLPQAEMGHWYIEPHFVFSASILIPVLLLTLLALIGVLFFRNWGRWLYTGSTLLSLCFSVFLGPSIYYGWESALWDAATMATGAIILAMFLPPLKSEFEN